MKRIIALVFIFTVPIILFGQNNSDTSQLKPFDTSKLISSEVTSVSQPVSVPSRGKAFLLSFLLPGMGEYYAGSPRMGKIFLGTEASLWMAFGSLQYYGKRLEHDYKLFAAAHAGLNTSGKDHAFLVDVENYPSLAAYNADQLRRRNLKAMYPETEEYNWDWDSEDNRWKFEELRTNADRAFRSSMIVVGGIVVNHIISSIDAIRIVRKHEKRAEQSLSYGIIPRPEGGFQVAVLAIF